MATEGFRVEEHHGKWRWIGDEHGPLHGRSGDSATTEEQAREAAYAALGGIRETGSRDRFAATLGEFVAVFDVDGQEQRTHYSDYEHLLHGLLMVRQQQADVTVPAAVLVEVIRTPPGGETADPVDLDRLQSDLERHTDIT